jgi:hypothetical protein
MEETPVKTISDMKKMLLTRLFFMEMKLYQNQKLSRDGAEFN